MQKKDVAILDFGSEKITVFVGHRDVNNTFAISGVGESEYAGFLNGEFLEPDKLKVAMGVAITNAEENAKCSIHQLYIGVPAEFCYCICKNASLNFQKLKNVTKNDIAELFMQANNFSDVKSHMVINQSSIYYVLNDSVKAVNPIGMSAQKLSASLSFVLAENNFIELINSFMYDLEISSVEYISTELAQALFLLDEDERDAYAIMVDCGYITTSVSLIKGNGLLSLSSFSLGGGHITADLSECLKIPFSEAEALKRKIVLSIEPSEKDSYEVVVDSQPTPISSAVANDIVESRIEDIARGILKCISTWKYEYPDFIPIYITGGGLSYLKGAKDLLSKMIGKNIEVIAPATTQYNKPHLSSSLALLNSALSQEELKQPKTLWGRIKKFFS